MAKRLVTSAGLPAAPPPVQVPRARYLAKEVSPASDEPREVPKRRLACALDWLGGRRSMATSFVASGAVHAVLLVLLGLWSLAAERGHGDLGLIASISGSIQQGVDSLAVTVAPMPQDERLSAVDALVAPPTEQHLQAAVTALALDQRVLGVGTASVPQASGAPAGGLQGKPGDLDGRGSSQKGRLLGPGDDGRSEEAVKRGLNWLAAHQRTNGSWNFNHQAAPCSGACGNPGSERSTTAATALALLCYLGAGHTDREGDYQPVVRSGLYYLRARMQPSDHGADFQEGTMYAQGLSAIALCEAFAMTKDESLREVAQSSLDFIGYAQDKNGGGWRYMPGEPGDTTVTGWMLMALRAGQIGYLRPSTISIERSVRFLDSVGSEEGAYYGYLYPGKEPTSTAIGLLCRMYTGWGRDNPSLAKGVRYLAARGPSPFDMYYNYYATQVLRYWGGSDWTYWNRKLREQLIRTQATDGHESGSWHFPEDTKSSVKGGRLYNTCMAIMTLEVYYRYLPIYDKAASF